MNDLLMLFFIIALAIGALAVIFLGGAFVMAKRCVEVLQGWMPHSEPTTIKLMIMGHARHGKDTACEYLRDKHGLTFKSSSEAACEIVIYPTLKELHGYKTIEECFNDRVNHRQTWYDLIRRYNLKNPTRLAQDIYATNDIYCGIRSIHEFDAIEAAGLFDLSIWIDASHRLPAESQDSCTVTKQDADIVISNNGTVEQLYAALDRMMLTIATPNKKIGMAI